MKLTEATPEQIKKMGDRYVSPLVDGKVRRQSGARQLALEMIYNKSNKLSCDQYTALTELRTFLDGQSRYLGLTSSYGDQRWNGTPISQRIENAAVKRTSRLINEEWPIYCGQKVREAEFRIDHPTAWGVIVMVLKEDKTLSDVGKTFGISEKKGYEKASRLFHLAATKYCPQYQFRPPP